MEIENFEAAMEKVRGLLRREAPFKRQDTFSCSKIAGSAFEKIRTAREEGFSFAQICAALEEAGLLSGNANPHSFRQAFCRETLRREGCKKLPEVFSKPTEPKHIAASPVRPDEKKTEVPSTGTAPGSEEAMRERIKMLTAHVVVMGMGKITKFDYD